MAAAPPPLENFQVSSLPLFLIGTFETGVTVWNQQVRALNLAHALVENGVVSCNTEPGAVADERLEKRIAIVGGGFAGLTLAAALIKKRANVAITIFEQRDTLLPLQQGSDSRWLHPHIYDWPADGSEAAVAMLPVLNWTAARASDVAVEVLNDWKRISDRVSNLSVVCNARHLKIDHCTPPDAAKLRIEWVGERRGPDGLTKDQSDGQVGAAEDFNAIVLAVGFGLERQTTFSYWRNETLGQPNLDQPRRTFIVAGQGDGAMIDLLRLRVSQFRQDRILEEIFSARPSLSKSIAQIFERQKKVTTNLFEEFEKLDRNDHECHSEFRSVIDGLRRRLRRDTEVILRLKVQRFSELFDGNLKISFQNKLLVYLLYKCGGFFPSSIEIEELSAEHKVSKNQIVRRFGPLNQDHLGHILSGALNAALDTDDLSRFSQSDAIAWPGGYFGYPGKSATRETLDESFRDDWRKEYLPGATALLGASLSSAIAGYLHSRHTSPGRLRVALHRTMQVGTEELLQQTCDYVGTDDAKGPKSAAGRTFEKDVATIGQAYLRRQIIRSVAGVKPEVLRATMEKLNLRYSSRAMSREVSFVLAIPLLEPESSYTLNTPVVGIIYVDSTALNFFVSDDDLKVIVKMAQSFLIELERPISMDRVRNEILSKTSTSIHPADTSSLLEGLEIVGSIECPRTAGPFQLNFGHSDFLNARMDPS